jgi:hypothetical protein
MKGTFTARAIAWGINIKNEKERVEVVFQLKDQPVQRTWFGYLHLESCAERTLESLEYCGWDGVSLKRLDGMGTRDVNIVIEEETYEGKIRDKVQWVNEVRAIEQAPESTLDALEARLLKNRKPKAEDFEDPFAVPGGAS